MSQAPFRDLLNSSICYEDVEVYSDSFFDKQSRAQSAMVSTVALEIYNNIVAMKKQEDNEDNTDKK